MANDFKIIISAQDKATASVKRINDSISKMMRPFQNVQRSMNNLTKELNRNPVVKSLKAVGSAALGVAESVAKIAAPMAALIGVGSIAGLGILITEWGRLGFEISNTSKLLGVSTDSLQSLRGAAQLAGLSTEQLTGGLESVRSTLQDAKWGRNNDVAMLMNRIGMSFKFTAAGSVDAADGLKDVADAVAAQQDLGAKHTIARAFGVEALLPLLMKGRKGIEEYEKKAAELAGFKGPNAIEQARQFGERLNEMTISIQGLKTEIGSALLPVLDPLVQRFRDLIATNREAIGAKIGEWAQRMGDWIGSLKKEDFDKFADNMKVIGSAIAFVVDKIADLIGAFTKLKNVNPLKYGIGGVPRMIYDWATSREGNQEPRGPSVSGKITYGATAPASAPSSGRPPPGNNGSGLRYNDPLLNTYANRVEENLGLPKNILNGLKNFGERSNSNDVSPKGARGVMQFMPYTWSKFGHGNPTNPYDSIDAGGAYVKDLLTRHGENMAAAITEYNGGSAQAREVDFGGQPWAKETRNYLSRVQSGMASMNGTAAPAQEHNFTMTIEGLPPGVSASVRNQAGQKIPVRVSMTMPQMVTP